MEKIVEVDFCNVSKHLQKIAGDVFQQNVSPNDENRLVCTLSDGLGSGVKANVLAMLTAAMAQKFIMNNMDVKLAANIIRSTLPVCSIRKISYSTFTTIDVDSNIKTTKVIEFDNPPYLLVRKGNILKVNKKAIDLEKQQNVMRNSLLYSEFKMELGDRVILFSDGVTQSGMGTKKLPLGWRIGGVKRFILDLLQEKENISARLLSNLIVKEAIKNDIFFPKDDITCAVLYYRKARQLLVITGPPFDKSKDDYIVERFKEFAGEKVVCGGTTSQIISKKLGIKVKINIFERDVDVPPTSTMEGAALVTEGMLTLNKIAEILESHSFKEYEEPKNGATKLVDMFLNSDCIHFLVGTAINNAHQDPHLPVELGLRRITVKKIAHLLRENYLKKVLVEYI